MAEISGVHVRESFSSLEASSEFIERHIGPSESDQAEMLAALGFATRDALIEAIIPNDIRRSVDMALPEAVSEQQALSEIKALAEKNKVYKSFIGQGYYGTVIPPVIQRNVLENPAWYTSYTPYQPEISQGRLEALINFQQMVIDLTAMDVANASMLDEGTAAAEAMTLARRVAKAKSNVFIVASDCHPQTIDIIQTRAEPLGIELKIGFVPDLIKKTESFFGVLAQYPSTIGLLHDMQECVDQAHAKHALFIVASDLLALTLLKPPGEWGADVVVGNSQRFGVPLGFGGPHAAFMAVTEGCQRQMPGRLVGVSVDRHGQPAYRLALQTREQHIRREKATSNICTAQALLAIMAGMYACYHGAKGLRRIATRVHRLAATFRAGLLKIGLDAPAATFFDTIFVNTGEMTESILARANQFELNVRQVSAAAIAVSFDETSNKADVSQLWRVFSEHLAYLASFDELEAQQDALSIPVKFQRTSEFLTHPVFNRYHSETEMLRYLRHLSDKDLALDRTMIPLGSCTMKLNATSEMLPITWPEFANIHPFAPATQTQGYLTLIQQLEAMLVEATGYAAVSLQPNSGAQGEYAGLLAIRAYHKAHGQAQRNICLIPSSAHGTNPASANLAGMEVVVVACDSSGNVDVADLKQKAEKHNDRLAAIMITYPSTHGVFEGAIREICAIVHAHGGQVYVDGANMNAMVGLTAPGEWGGDVSHLNLHKTFCIPHGGADPTPPVNCALLLGTLGVWVVPKSFFAKV